MLSVSGITKRYGKNQILDDISFEVKPGEIIAIIGKNGCGKSTLLKILAGIIKADEGKILFWNHDSSKNRKVFAKYAGYVPQDNPLMEELSVKDNIKLWNEKKEVDETVLDAFDLKRILNQKVNTLSGGMKRRLSIATTLINKPPVLILDEPTSSLDIYYQESIVNTLLEFKKGNGIVIMSTHTEREILIADRVFILENGKLTNLQGEQINMDAIRKHFLNCI